MSFGPEHFGLYTYEDWAKNPYRRISHGLHPFSVKSGENGEVRIEPDIVEQRGVTVVGHDWVPVLSDGRGTIDRMVHTPELYIDKMRNIRRDESGFRFCTSRMTLCSADAILVGGSRNYYHWFVNHVPRLLWARELGLLGKRVVLINDKLTDFQKQTLEILAIDEARLRQVPDDEGVVCANVLVPSFLARSTLMHTVIPKFFRRAFPPRRKGAGRRVYISRRDAASRRLVNEQEIESRLAGLGFEIVHLIGMPVQDQIDLFSSASVVIGAHGAGLTNLLFSEPGTRVLEIYSPLHKVTSMRLLSAVCKHKHALVPAESVSFGEDGNPLLGDWKVDVAQLEAALVHALAS